MTTITVRNPTDALYDSRQNDVARAYVCLDCDDGTLYTTTRFTGDGTPFHVYHGRTQQWRVPTLTAQAACVLLAEIAPLAQRVVTGFSTRWDGNNNVGTFDADADAARDEIAVLCDGEFPESDVHAEWDAEDYFQACGPRDLGITAGMTSEQLDEAIDREDAAAESYGVSLSGTARFMREMLARENEKAAEAAEAAAQGA